MPTEFTSTIAKIYEPEQFKQAAATWIKKVSELELIKKDCTKEKSKKKKETTAAAKAALLATKEAVKSGIQMWVNDSASFSELPTTEQCKKLDLIEGKIKLYIDDYPKLAQFLIERSC